ncbi:MAG TPA: hypothetical protein VK735_03970, partial [Pseudonocardia sp.]|nr:hypothetical protein [Pseudonocardia sp.]
RLGRRAEQVAFIDDLPRNVDAAAALGIHAILFTDESGCRAELARLGALGPADTGSEATSCG